MASYKLKILEIRNSKAHIQCSGILIVDGYAEPYELGKIRIIKKGFYGEELKWINYNISEKMNS